MRDGGASARLRAGGTVPALDGTLTLGVAISCRSVDLPRRPAPLLSLLMIPCVSPIVKPQSCGGVQVTQRQPRHVVQRPHSPKMVPRTT